MQEKYKRLTALLFDGVSIASFVGSLNYVNQLDIPTIPSKKIALIEDYAILALQSGETLVDIISKRFETKSRRSKAWYRIKTAGIPLVLSAVAVTIFYSYHFNPHFNPSQGSNICWIVGLASQYIKNILLYRK